MPGDDLRAARVAKGLSRKQLAALAGLHPDSVKYLFTTSTCPNCKIAKQMLAEAEEEYQLIDAEKNPELVSRYGIMQAPTLVVIEGDETKKYVNASNIQKYVEENE